METARLILRKFKIEDAADILEYASCAETVKDLEWEGVSALEEARTAIFDYYWSRPGIWAIEHKDNGKMIGCIDVRLKHEHDKASFGYVLNKKFWGNGYMTEALKAVLKLCFEKLEINRVESRHFAGNEASGRVMEKAGMVREGYAFKCEKIKGVFRDVAFYGIVRQF
jgi:ribosomal-protein-alanine N-acetyltransferase